MVQWKLFFIKPEFEPIFVRLTKMVLNLVKENTAAADRQAKCGRYRCSCFNGNNDCSSGDDLDMFGCSSQIWHSTLVFPVRPPIISRYTPFTLTSFCFSLLSSILIKSFQNILELPFLSFTGINSLCHVLNITMNVSFNSLEICVTYFH